MLEIACKLLAILASVLILVQAYCIRLAVGTFIFPACLMALAWFFYTFIPLVVLYDVPINPLAIMYLFVCISAFSMGALPFNWSRAFQINALKSSNNSSVLDSKLLVYFFYISALSSIFFSTIAMTSIGIDLHSIVFNLVKTSGEYAAMRGGKYGTFEYGIYGILSIFFTYLTTTLGGLAFYQHPNRLKQILYTIITFIPSLYFMLTQSAKLVIFYSIGFYLASLLLRKIYSNTLELFNWAIFLKGVIGILVLLPLLAISFISRENFYKLGSTSSGLLFSIKSYALGQTYAFSDYLSFYFGMDSQSRYTHDLNTFGQYTFTSLFTLFGYKKYFPPGTYPDGYFYKNLFATNIFTIFRGLINDFGVIGSIIFMFISGLVSHTFFYRLLTAKKSWSASAVFIIMVVYIEGTYLLSVFMARFMYLLIVGLILIFWINDKYKNRST